MSKKRSTKEALLDTAIALFQQQGFENVTIDDICNKNGVTKTAFYYYFKSKDDLIRDYFSTDDMLSSDELASILDAEDYVEQIIRCMEIRVVRIAKAGVALTKELYRIYLKDEITPLLSEPTGLSEVIMKAIERAQTAGQLTPTISSDLIHTALCCLYNGTILKWIIDAGNFDLIKETRKLCALILTQP
ncbi:MAG TPA: TetR/AcrR family transcriptional regulator [Ruminococcaceae bacterium]|nr:TetR/AcrR family transcriptional regulator [Oscillospiraceae bacterium]